MISELLHSALTAMAPNRSSESWLAGSTVMAEHIERVPNDIDVHHVHAAAFETSVLKDSIALQAAGFRCVSARKTDDELEVVFSHPQGRLTVNWVLEADLPRGGLKPDMRFGTRASYKEVVLRKLEMLEESDDPKHLRDLLQLRANMPALSELGVDLVTRLNGLTSKDIRKTA